MCHIIMYYIFSLTGSHSHKAEIRHMVVLSQEGKKHKTVDIRAV